MGNPGITKNASEEQVCSVSISSYIAANPSNVMDFFKSREQNIPVSKNFEG
jgi:hypothetical protein